MAESEDRHVILLSVRPKYAERIMAGEKTVEFRKRNIPESLGYVLLYATAPRRRIVGYFSVASIVEDAPSNLWHMYGTSGGISRQEFLKYYSTSARGVAIMVEDVHRFITPIPPGSFNGGSPMPQSFAYVHMRDWQKVRRRRTERIEREGTNRQREFRG